MTVIEIHLSAFDLALIGLHRSFVLMNKRHLGVQCLAGNRILSIQLLIANQVDSRILKQRSILFQLSLLLVQNGLERPRINLRQEVSLPFSQYLLVYNYVNLLWRHELTQLYIDIHMYPLYGATNIWQA